jgi:hypothetical protein
MLQTVYSVLDHTRDVPGNILERIAIVNLIGKSNSPQGTRPIALPRAFVVYCQ